MGWLSLRNRLDYGLRCRLRLRRRGVRLRHERKDDLFGHLSAGDRPAAEALAARLRADYRLDDLYTHSDRRGYRENLYYAHLVETALAAAGRVLPDPLRAADVGVAHWFYVRALHAVLSWWGASCGRSVDLTGWEVDAWRLHADLHARIDHAEAQLAGLPGTRYVPAAFTAQPGACDWVSLFFPFVFPRDHLRWGLPTPLFAAEDLLAAAWASVAPGGLLVVVNQGAAEAAAQARLFARVGVAPRASFTYESALFQYKLDRRVWVAVRG